MKTFQILATFFLLFTAYFSFGQRQLNVTDQSNSSKISLQNYNPLNTNTLTYTADCEFDPCSETKINAIENFRPLANETCQDIMFCVTCCSGGYETHIILVIEPDDPRCEKAKPQKASASNDF